MKLFGLILLLFVPFASSFVIDCEFKIGNWAVINNIYGCEPKINPTITDRDIVMTSATGNHHNGSMNHASVKGFRILNSSHTISYMFRGLINVFPNLIAIMISSCHMKEIRQTDLQPYSKLKNLDLDSNDIETLERNLFKNNPQLEAIFLQHNKIKQVHPNVFDQLSELQYLYMNYNSCVTENGSTRTDALKLITKIKDQCDNYDLVNEIEANVTKIGDQVKVHIENMKSQIDDLALKMENSNSKIDILTKMIQDMLKITSENTTVITQNFNQQLMNQQLSTQSKLNKLEVKIDQMEQHIVAIVDAILNDGNTTTSP
jgi:chaperonin cofactor prefoldin